MTIPAPRHGAYCSSCLDSAGPACEGCTTFRIEGTPPAVGQALVRLEDLGWRLHTSPEQESPGVWRLQVSVAEIGS